MEAYLMYADSRASFSLCGSANGDTTTYVLPRADVPSGCTRIVLPLHEPISAQDPGYLVLPRGSANADYALFHFARHSEDFSVLHTGSNMPVYGVKSADGVYLTVVAGMSWDYSLRVTRENGAYSIIPEIAVPADGLYEDVVLHVIRLGAEEDYSAMARRYRKYLLDRGILHSISERAETYPAVGYFADAPLIRIRCGWKKAPSDVLHQTRENEPPMRVACTFDRIATFCEALKEAGVARANISLVGWNVRGHDGRWPEAFPVEPALGGAEGLKRLRETTDRLGYMLSCHTNHTDQYEIAENYSADNTRRNEAGERVKNAVWSGGQMYDLCPKIGLSQAKSLFPQVRDAGFDGIHYVDVIGIVPPRSCSHPAHPVTRREAIAYAIEMAQESRRIFGGFSTEGVYDFLAPYMDYGLYASFSEASGELGDTSIPFWQLVYHGYTMANPYTRTVNASFKSRESVLKMLEYSGHPTYYLYSAFMANGNNWMGKLSDDPILDTEADLRRTVDGIAAGYREWQRWKRLELLPMEHHTIRDDGVREIVYADGTMVRIDYANETYSIT